MHITEPFKDLLAGYHYVLENYPEVNPTVRLPVLTY